MDDLLADFIAETRDMLRGCEGALVRWEAQPADRQQLDEIFRFVHTVKGNCGFFDLPRLAALSHAAETALGEVRAGRREADTALVSAVLAIIDRIVELVDALEQDREVAADGDEALIAAVVDGSLPGSEAPGPIPAFAEPAVPAVPMTPARSIRLPVDLLDRVMSGVSDMVLARNDLSRKLRDSRSAQDLEGPFERLSGILADVREAITRMRMNRIEQLYLAIPRLVRDLSNELGKQVAVTFEGGDVELDREIMELIRDPLTHLLRNAVDHGIEPPAQRLAAGKRETGSLTITAHHSGNEVHITVTDDGRGIDTARVAVKAVEAGLLSQVEADDLSESRRLQLIFEPGLSTAQQISEVSGRGVGMDVVRANLERIGGTIQVTSVPGERTVFQLKVPLTLSIVPGVIVETQGQRFAIAQSYVIEIIRRRAADPAPVRMGGTRLLEVRGQRIPYLRLDRVLGLVPATDEEVDGGEPCETVVILQVGHEDRYALGVSRISDYEDLVIKPLAPAIMRTGYYSGLTLLDDGQPILLLDAREIAVKHGLLLGGEEKLRLVEESTASVAALEETALLFTGLDGMELAVRFPLIGRIVLLNSGKVDRTGGRPLVPLDGAILPVAGCSKDLPEDTELRALCLSDGERQLLYAVASIGERVPIGAAEMLELDDQRFERMFLVDGRPVRLLAAHWLFATALPETGGKRLRCALPDDPWANNILAPLLISAGYHVDSSGDGRADVTIAIDGRSAPGGGSRIIHLYSDTAAQPGDIHRYDRDRLLAELGKVARGDAA